MRYKNKLRSIIFVFFATLPLLFAGAGAVETSAKKVIHTGKASYYSDKFNGRKTSSGEIFRNNHYTAAHPYLPYGTVVKVTNLENQKTVKVKINDRFRPGKGHIIDITKAAAREIDLIRYGMARVSLEVINDTITENLIINDSIPQGFITEKLIEPGPQVIGGTVFPQSTINIDKNISNRLK
jgi:rare lipoprotein A